jgi:uncharacterized protein
MIPTDETSRPPAHAPGRIVVAGGSGFLGGHLIPALRNAGYDVVVLGRGAAPPGGDGRTRFVTWQPGSVGPWQRELEGATALINLCGAGIGAGRWTPARKRELVESRTVPSAALVAACNRLDAPPAVCMQASGVGYYGTGEAERDEHSPAGEDFLARLAVAWEAPLKDARTRTVPLRFGVVLGRDGGALAQMLLPFRLFIGGPIGHGRQWLSWIHVTDAVRAVLHLLAAPPEIGSGPINVTAPNPVRNVDFARSAGAALRRPAGLPLPRWVLQTALGEQATLVCDGQQALPRKLARAGFEFRFPTLIEALTDLTGPAGG